MNIDVKGSVSDLVPTLNTVLTWVGEHYLIVMAFTVVLVALVEWGRRRRS